MPKPKLPAAITVGPYLYRVTLKSAREMCTKEGTECLGLCDNDGLEISILRSLQKAKKREVLLHEILHSAAYCSGRNPEDLLTGEQFVEATVHPLLQILRDNPELLYYLIA
jgi:hypothetical protein